MSGTGFASVSVTADPAATSALSDALWWLADGMRYMFYLEPPSKLALGDGDEVPQYFLKYGLPMFFVFMAVEAVVLKLVRGKTYRLNDAIAGVVLGSFQQVALLAFDVLGWQIEATAYRLVYEHCRVFTIDAKQNVMFVWWCLFLGRDIGYYWAHRFFHEWHIMWVGHSCHHSGEDYNMATALRQGAAQPIFGFVFYLPFALLGFHPTAFSAHAQLNLLYMYWIHTELINRLPLGLEYVLNTPMAHRMHHRPPGNCNYAGVLIIWDRMFGTYQPELVRKDYYGLAKPASTFDPAKLNVNHLNRMNDIGGAQSGWLGSVFKRRVAARWVFRPLALFEPIPPLKADESHTPVREKWDGAQPTGVATRAFLVVVFVAALVGSVGLLLQAPSMHVADALVSVVAALALLSALCRVADAKSGAVIGGESARAMVQCVVLAPVLFGVVVHQPLGAMLADKLPRMVVQS